MKNYEFDIAISYHNEIEEKATKIYDYLITDGWKVFFAPAKQQELLSEKVHQIIYDIYKNRSLMKVLLISESYLESEWTSLEKRMSLESTKGNIKRLFIVNYTNHPVLSNELQKLLYLDGRKFQEDEIASMVTARLKNIVSNNGRNRVEGKNSEKQKQSVVINKGVITGDNASFGDIHL